MEIGEFNSADKVEVEQGLNKTIGEEILETTQGHIKILDDMIVEENKEVITGMKITVEIAVGVGLEKGHFQRIILIVIIEGMIEV